MDSRFEAAGSSSKRSCTIHINLAAVIGPLSPSPSSKSNARSPTSRHLNEWVQDRSSRCPKCRHGLQISRKRRPCWKFPAQSNTEQSSCAMIWATQREHQRHQKVLLERQASAKPSHRCLTKLRWTLGIERQPEQNCAKKTGIRYLRGGIGPGLAMELLLKQQSSSQAFENWMTWHAIAASLSFHCCRARAKCMSIESCSQTARTTRSRKAV